MAKIGQKWANFLRHSMIAKLLSPQVTNYLKQSARLKGHKNIKGWKIYDNCKMLTFGLFQKRSFLKMENLTMPPTISYLQLEEIWASKSVCFSIASYCCGNFIYTFPIHNDDDSSPKCGDPNDNSTEALETKVYIYKGIIRALHCSD